MKKENITDLLYPDDHAELLRRIRSRHDKGAWSEGVHEFLDQAEANLRKNELVSTEHDYAKA